MSDQTDPEPSMTERAGAMIDTLTAAFLRATEVAAERLQLACDVAAIQQRLAAFSSVLETIGAQKLALAEKMETTKGAARTLYATQIKMLEAQEVAVLTRVGVPQPVAVAALAGGEEDEAAVYRRDGKRFVRLPSTNGSAEGN